MAQPVANDKMQAVKRNLALQGASQYLKFSVGDTRVYFLVTVCLYDQP